MGRGGGFCEEFAAVVLGIPPGGEFGFERCDLFGVFGIVDEVLDFPGAAVTW